MVSSAKNYIIEKRWALIAILLGTILGFGSAIVCIAWNLVIFGFNIMYIVSPLLAGFVESVIASKKYGRSTGAISALLTFFLINGYGWFGPGWIFPKEPATLSLITIIAIILTLQAAFPILINYILVVVTLGSLNKILGFLLRKPAQISANLVEDRENGGITPQADEIFLEGLKIPLLTVHPVNGDKIDEYLGLVVGESVAQENETEGRFSSILKIIEPVRLQDMNLGDARKDALSRMLEEAQILGANAVEEVLIDYVSVGGLQGNATIVAATGTAIVIKDGNSTDNEYKSDIFLADEEDTSGSLEEDSADNMSETKSEGDKKITKKDYHVDNNLSERIERYIYEKNNPSTKEREIIIKNEFEELDKRYERISRDIESIDQKSTYYDEKYGDYINRKIQKMYGGAKLVSSYDTPKNNRVRIKEGLIGKEVLDANLKVMGKVKEVKTSSQNKVETLIVGSGGILERIGVSKNDIVIPYRMVSSMGDKIILKK